MSKEKTKKSILLQPAIPLLDSYPQTMGMCIHKDTYKNVRNTWQPKMESTQKEISSKWRNELWFIYSRECYTVMRVNRQLPQEAWLNVTSIALGRRDQTQRCTLWVHLYEVQKQAKLSVLLEIRRVVTFNRGKGPKRLLACFAFVFVFLDLGAFYTSVFTQKFLRVNTLVTCMCIYILSW